MKIKWSLDINTGAVERSEAARARRLAGATVVGPVTAWADQLWHAKTGPPDQIWRRTNYCVTVPLDTWKVIFSMRNTVPYSGYFFNLSPNSPLGLGGENFIVKNLLKLNLLY